MALESITESLTSGALCLGSFFFLSRSFIHVMTIGLLNGERWDTALGRYQLVGTSQQTADSSVYDYTPGKDVLKVKPL